MSNDARYEVKEIGVFHPKMFPQAKFIHIHRNPYAVFQSSKKMFKVNFEMNRMQRVREWPADDRHGQ